MIKFSSLIKEDVNERPYLNKWYSPKEVEDKLHNATIEKAKPQDIKNIREYTCDSSRINHPLLHSLPPLLNGLKDTHNSIIDSSRATGHHFYAYTGSPKADFAEMAKNSKDGILHSPAHISTSLHKSVAESFSRPLTKTSSVSRINIGPEHRVVYVGKHSQHPHEKELIIPAGTNLKYTHTDNNGIHHFDIHSQDLNHAPNFDHAQIDKNLDTILKRPDMNVRKWITSQLNSGRILNSFSPDHMKALADNVAKTPHDYIKHFGIASLVSQHTDKNHIVDQTLHHKNEEFARDILRYGHAKHRRLDLLKSIGRHDVVSALASSKYFVQSVKPDELDVLVDKVKTAKVSDPEILKNLKNSKHYQREHDSKLHGISLN